MFGVYKVRDHVCVRINVCKETLKAHLSGYGRKRKMGASILERLVQGRNNLDPEALTKRTLSFYCGTGLENVLVQVR